MPKPCRRQFGHAWGPSTPASAMVLAIFRWAAVAGGLRRRRAERVDELEGAEQFGRDGDLAPVLRAVLQCFRVRIRIEAVSSSMSMGRTAGFRGGGHRAGCLGRGWHRGFPGERGCGSQQREASGGQRNQGWRHWRAGLVLRGGRFRHQGVLLQEKHGQRRRESVQIRRLGRQSSCKRSFSR